MINWRPLLFFFLVTALWAEESDNRGGSRKCALSAYDIINETRSEMEASGIPWRTPTFTIVAQNRPIADLLTDFGNQQGIRVHVSPQVRGEISGSFIDQSPSVFLAQMTKAYGLSWFYVNGLLYVASNQEVNLIVKPLRYVKADAALAMLNTSGFISSDGRVEKIKDSGMVTLSGIPKYIELTQQLLNSMDTETQFHDNGETVIEVFPLNNAWAYDVNVGGPAGATVRGVATTLRQLIWGYGAGAGGARGPGGASANGALNKMGQPNQMAAPNQSTGVLPPTSQQTPPGYSGNAPAMANSSSGAGGPGGAGETPDGLPPASESPMLPKNSSGGPGSDWTYAMITADVRRNAVVIRDIRANMPLYEAAIRKLDVPVRIIEISAAIVDLQLGASRTLGLNTSSINSGQMNIGGNTVTLGGVAQSAPLAPAANLGLSGVFGTTAVSAAINALSAENKAKVLSRPTILTLDNFGAYITNQETFYVNSVGQYVSNLYNVSVGLSLQVVPHVTIHHGETRIYLQVQIQDGKSTPQSVGTLPTVEESLLTTQSVVREDQSLLIGGLYKKVNKKDGSGYPWLYKVPVVSFLFGVKSTAKEIVERIFVITPRIVEINSKNLGDYSDYFKPSPTVENALDTEKLSNTLPSLKDPASGFGKSSSSGPTYQTTDSGKNVQRKSAPIKRNVPQPSPSPTPYLHKKDEGSGAPLSLPTDLSIDD